MILFSWIKRKRAEKAERLRKEDEARRKKLRETLDAIGSLHKQIAEVKAEYEKLKRIE